MENDKECLNCGGKILKKNKFCNNSCASTFNNKKRIITDETKKKLRNKLSLNDSVITKIKILKDEGCKIKDIANELNISSSSVSKYTDNNKINIKNKIDFNCSNCDKKLETKRVYCDVLCANKHKHIVRYNDFLNNNEKYCIGNYTPKYFKNDFLNEQNGECDICKCNTVWNDKKIVFILDHIDGDSSNNKRENLRLVCPNCDSQLDTYKSKNKNSARRSYYRMQQVV